MKNTTIANGVMAALILTFMGVVLYSLLSVQNEEMRIGVCPADALLCPDGSYVGRSGPDCEFVCPASETTTDVPFTPSTPEPASTTAPIIVATPAANAIVMSPLQLSGQAPGSWYFEATAPVVIVNWDGLIIAEGYITAEGEWMTTDFVPFSGTLEFTSPYKVGDPEFMQRGAIIFKKDNPSGLPEHDDALEIPILFAPQGE